MATKNSIDQRAQALKWIVSSLRTFAFGIPLAFLLYVLYWNFLPFGYSDNFIIDVGSDSDTKGEFRLELTDDISMPITDIDENTYRSLNGVVYAIFEPKASLKDSEIVVTLNSDGKSYLIPPAITFEPQAYSWNYSWDFTQGIPTNLEGPAQYSKNCAYFDGKTRLEVPDSEHLFEDGPFTLYVEWLPEDNVSNFQQIVGHFNWEFLQDRNAVRFQIGRMEDENGPIIAIQYPITSDFFGKKHSALMHYVPATTSEATGYIEMYVDGTHAARKHFNAGRIFADYGNENLSFGWSSHNFRNNPYFSGCIYNVFYSNNLYINGTKTLHLNHLNSSRIKIPISAIHTSLLDNIRLYVDSK